MNKFPYAAQKSERTFYSLVIPVEVFFRRCCEERKQPRRVCSIFRDQGIRIYNIPLRLAHFSAIFNDHALRQQIDKRFISGNMSQVAHYLCEKTCVQQVQHGMLNTADVLINRHPVVNCVTIKNAVFEVRRAVTQEIPG